MGLRLFFVYVVVHGSSGGSMVMGLRLGFWLSLVLRYRLLWVWVFS